MKTQWLKICEDLQNRLNPGTYKVWVAPLTADLEGEGKIRLSAPNGFVATWVRDMGSPPNTKQGVLDVRPGRVNRKEQRSRGDERKGRNAVSVSWRGARLYGNTASALDFC